MLQIFPEAPFERAAAYVERLPFTTFEGKSAAAARFFAEQAASIVLVQEANSIVIDQKEILEAFMAIKGDDEETAVLVRRGTFDSAENITGAVCPELTEVLQARFPDADAEISKAWAKTLSRMAVAIAVEMRQRAQISGRGGDNRLGAASAR